MRLKDNDVFFRFYCFCSSVAILFVFLILFVSMREKKEAVIPLAYEDNIQIEYFAKEMKNKKHAEFAVKYAKENDLPSTLLVAVMRAESLFDPYAVNLNKKSTDRGLCQLNSLTFYWVSENEAFDPETNIKLGAAFLKWCLTESKGNIVKALAYYNAGSGNVKRKNIGEDALDYVNRVLTAKAKYDRELKNAVK